jgi:CheY-like chemotaxis protein
MSEASCGIVMVVEDDAGIRESISEVLTDHEYVAIEVANGKEAIRRLRMAAEKPCLILLDIMMPVMDGWQFRALQIQDPELNAIPVVVLSAHTNLDEVVKGMHAAAVLRKPVRLATLLVTVERFCRH